MIRLLSLLWMVLLAGCVAASPDTTAPVISEIGSSNITGSTVTIVWKTNEEADSQVEYGTTAGYGSLTPLAVESVRAHSQTVTGLQPGVLYHYRVLSHDAAGNLATSLDNTFKTVSPIASAPPSGAAVMPAADANAPSVPTGLTATAVSSNQIDLIWTASTDNVGVAGYRVYRNGRQIAATASSGYSDKGVAASTVYRYRISAYDAAGNVSAQSEEVSGATPAPADTTPPVISGMTVKEITSNSATIRWSTDEPADTQIEYGTTPAYGNATAMIAALTTGHAQSLTGLSPSTRYHYRVKSRDAV